MRVLLDECLPKRLKAHFAGHKATTVPDSRHHMLGVSFVEGPTGAAPGETLHCVVELLYSGVDYSGLRASVGILVVEGRRIVATGNVEVGSGAG
jgi:hypothetical protein